MDFCFDRGQRPVIDKIAFVEEHRVGVAKLVAGGLTVEEAIDMPKRGAPLVVIGAPLAIAADSFNVAEGDLQALLAEITRRIRG